MEMDSYIGSQEKKKNAACGVSFFKENQFPALPAASRMKSHA